MGNKETFNDWKLLTRQSFLHPVPKPSHVSLQPNSLFFYFLGCCNVQMLLLTQEGFKMTVSLLCSCIVRAERTVSLFVWQKKSSSQDRVKSILHLQGATILLSFCIKRRDKKCRQPLWNYKNVFRPAAGGHTDHESSDSDHSFATSWKLKMPSNHEASK